MDFIKRNIFWLSIGMAFVALIVLYLVFVLPLRLDLKKSTDELKRGVTRLQALLLADIATPKKIEMARETAEVFSKQYAAVEKYFAGRRRGPVKFWPEVILRGKLEPALFIVAYKKKTKALVEDLSKDMEVGDSAFEWKSFEATLPQPKDCVPAMEKFRMYEDIVELLRSAKAVTSLGSVKLGKKDTRPFLKVRDLSFYTRSLDISAQVSYPRLLYLIAELERSDHNIFVDTISIKQTDMQMGEGEPPVSVSLKCSMLYGEKGED
ncbi:hypothetical protein ACFL01_02190 [Planctomycetota bacterium]